MATIYILITMDSRLIGKLYMQNPAIAAQIWNPESSPTKKELHSCFHRSDYIMMAFSAI